MKARSFECAAEAEWVEDSAVEREEEAVAPRVELPASWDEYLASLSKKSRHELRRKLRRLADIGEPELRAYTSPQDVESRLPQLLRFMVDSRADKAAFMSEQMGRFFHRMAGTCLLYTSPSPRDS